MLFPAGIVAIIFLIGVQAGTDEKSEQLAAFEKEIKDHPGEALAIARRAASVNGQDEKRLYELAAKQQEKNLSLLGLGQALELAEVFDKKLDDSQAGRRVRIAWLQQRGLGLNPPEVLRLLGLPRSTSTQVLYRRQIEKWVYDQPGSLWLTFVYTNGQSGRLQHVTLASAPER